MDSDSTSLWVFGYGSLCWHPGFQTTKAVIGHVRDYVRRFWQGNTTHRGVPGKPGRVATLIKEKQGVTWGVAYELTGDNALEYLNTREVSLGGYTTEIVQFYPREASDHHFPVLLYVATSSSKDWAGPAPLNQIATQITTSTGPTGHNVEYLLRLAEFMRKHIPDGYDEHLASLETIVRGHIKEKNMCMKSLMGERPSLDTVEAAPEPTGIPEPRRDTFQYSTNLPEKKLRCLNV